jgi:two-component system chemotaxis response regulator CheY
MATILIVDDNFTIQRVISHTLRREGYEVILADHGLMALELLQTQSVDLAIVDIAMPEMDGLTLLRHLRSQAEYQTLPIIMLTASGQDEDREVAKSQGANDFLTKPTGSHELIAAVERHLPA